MFINYKQTMIELGYSLEKDSTLIKELSEKVQVSINYFKDTGHIFIIFIDRKVKTPIILFCIGGLLFLVVLFIPGDFVEEFGLFQRQETYSEIVFQPNYLKEQSSTSCFGEEKFYQLSKYEFTNKQILKLYKDLRSVIDGSFNAEKIIEKDGYLFFNWENIDPTNEKQVFLGKVAQVYTFAILQISSISYRGKIRLVDKMNIYFLQNNSHSELALLAKSIVEDPRSYFPANMFLRFTLKDFKTSLGNIKYDVIFDTIEK